MSRDNEDSLKYDNLFVTDYKKDSNSGGDGEYTPLGSGKKSEYAIGRKKQENSIPPEQTPPKPPKASPSTKAKPKSTAAKKKHVSASSVQKAKKTAAKKPKGSVRQTAVKSVPASDKPKTKKKTPAKKRSSSAQKNSFKEEFVSFAYLGAMAAGGGIKKVFGNRRNRMIAAAILGIILIICCTKGVRSIYTSKTLFSEDGKNLDDTAIQERLITDEQNSDKVTYFLIVGVDKSQMLTDCIWVMCFDNAAHKMNVLQIPRDTYVGEDSKKPHKINAVYNNPRTVNWCEQCNKAVDEEEVSSGKHTVCGSEVQKRTESNINALIRCVNTRLSLPVDHYVLFDFEGYEKIIDAMGGVDIYLEEEMRVYPNKKDYDTLPAGLNHLDGAMALKFMRNRKIYAEGDLGRVKAQRRIIKAMFEKVDKMSAVEAMNVLSAAYGSFSTDMSISDIRSFIAPVKKCGADRLHMFELPGSGHWDKGHPSYYICDEQQAAEEINKYMLPYSQKITAYNISFPELEY